ncbi:phage minor tail protein L [Pseudomonas sp. RIT-PI-AD]|uniref:phage minor tail protein L n=1 Tax=Pseudomonas sp. RIT-PI-AD TaxID=3035294 RepID=UPI0021DA707A|nr:phage minor tail protein L [Pseudomonas sp. RIT-PI-AD]
MSLQTDVQLLEPGSEIRLFELDCTDFDGDIVRFHGHAVAHTPEEIEQAGAAADRLPAKSIWWQGNEYHAWPVKIEGLEATGDGTSPRPTLSVGNVDGSISALCLHFDDLAQARVIVHETLAHYLDARNFVNGNASADPTAEATETWFIFQKTLENADQVQFALSSPADVSGQFLPGRQIASSCHWCMTGGYRGPDCGYTGTRYFDGDDKPVDDPSRDECSGTVRACKLRFGADSPLPHGGFPGAALLRR